MDFLISSAYIGLNQELGIYNYEIEHTNSKKVRAVRVFWATIVIFGVLDVIYIFAASNEAPILNALLAAVLLTEAYLTAPIMLFERKVYQHYYDLMHQFYLEKVPVFHYIDRWVFQRIAYYLDHGLCYEVAFLFMLMSRGNKNSRFVVAIAKNRKKEKNQHAWMEFKACGFWWVIDPTWEFLHTITPRFLHTVKTRPEILRVVNYDEFWSYKITNRFYDLLQDPKTSHLFTDLSAFRCLNGNRNTTFLFEKFGEDCFAPYDGKHTHLSFIGVYGNDHPVTPRMLKRYLVKITCRHPKAQSVRAGKTLLRTIDRAYADTKKLREKHPGVEYEIAFETFKDYEIKEKSPSEPVKSPAA